MARLILSFDGRELRDLPVGTRGMVIGRSPDNDVMIDNLAVSNHHARITWVQEQLFVEDLQSLNGTFVNDMRIERSFLQHGDSIKIGKHALLVDTAYITVAAPDTGQQSRRSQSGRNRCARYQAGSRHVSASRSHG